MSTQKRTSIKEVKKNLTKYYTEQHLSYLNEQGYILFHNEYDKDTELLTYCYFIHPDEKEFYFLFHIKAPSLGLVRNYIQKMADLHRNIVHSYQKFVTNLNRKITIDTL